MSDKYNMLMTIKVRIPISEKDAADARGKFPGMSDHEALTSQMEANRSEIEKEVSKGNGGELLQFEMVLEDASE